jgi:uncharacterized membrane protein HdeD (DUF308 family)
MSKNNKDTVTSILGKQKTSSIIIAILSVILGVVLIIYKNTAANWFVKVIGILMIVAAIYYTISFFTRASKDSISRTNLVVGILLLILGIWFLTSSNVVLQVVQLIIGVIIIMQGILDLQAALAMKDNENSNWGVSLCLALATIILGVLLIFLPFKTLDVLLVMLGIVLIFDGISDMYIIGVFSKTANTVRKAAAEAEQEANAIETEGEIIPDDNSESGEDTAPASAAEADAESPEENLQDKQPDAEKPE